MSEEEIIKAIDSLFSSYDAFYFANKYSSFEDFIGNTHEKEFSILLNYFNKNEKCLHALKWIMQCYDCYYCEEFEDENSAFNYLKQHIK